MKPLFIVIEGIDGSGKSTFTKNLRELLITFNRTTVCFAEPTSYDSGIYIRRFLKGEVMLSKKEQIDAFLVDRENSVQKNILPNLKQNIDVILDRYYYSTCAYQASDEFDAKSILNLNLKKNFPSPDILFFLDISPEQALERTKTRNSEKEIFDSIEKQKQIYSEFKKILPGSTNFLDASLSQDSIIDEAKKILIKFL
ncbi:MAG: dTMP kinase [Leptospiraceae bacterium]|nr:dTMP kinase [Leptospiraceae bacterium]